jgi:hypothetical protein
VVTERRKIIMTKNTYKSFTLGLCDKRHIIKDVDDYIFDDGDITFPIDPKGLQNHVVKKFKEIGLNMGDDLTLYVTGLTPALTSVIRICFKNSITLTLMHYDNASGDYIPDAIFTGNDVCYDIEYPAWVACP